MTPVSGLRVGTWVALDFGPLHGVGQVSARPRNGIVWVVWHTGQLAKANPYPHQNRTKREMLIGEVRVRLDQIRLATLEETASAQLAGSQGADL